MTNIAKHSSTGTTKLLAVGYSGTGKTGALAALAASGYNLRIMDFDKGLDILRDYVVNPESIYVKKDPKASDRIDYLSFHSKIKNIQGKLQPIRADAWQKAMGALAEWKDEDHNLGAITTWTQQDVLVVDSFTALNDAALDFILQVNARLGQQPYESDWGQAQGLVKSFLNVVTDPEVKCNVILNCHIKEIEKENGGQTTSKLYPNALGKALPPEIPRFFNTMLEFKSQGGKKTIQTHSLGGLDLKTTAPLKVAKTYDIEWGLAEYFKAVRGTTNQPPA